MAKEFAFSFAEEFFSKSSPKPVQSCFCSLEGAREYRVLPFSSLAPSSVSFYWFSSLRLNQMHSLQKTPQRTVFSAGFRNSGKCGVVSGSESRRKETCNVELILLVLIPRLSKNLLVSWWLESFPHTHAGCWYGWLWGDLRFAQRMKLELLHLLCRALHPCSLSSHHFSPFLVSFHIRL